MVNLSYKNNKLLLTKKLIIIETIKIKLTIKVIVTKTLLIITIMIRCTGRYRTPTTANTELLAPSDIAQWP